jgi:hypothetical protein
MQQGAGGLWTAGMPKLKKSVLDQDPVPMVRYYVGVDTVDAGVGQTQEYQARPVRKIEECKKRPVLAARASPGNFPAQFIAGAAIPIVPLAIVGVGAAAGGVALAAGGDDEPAPTNPPVTQPPPTAPPTVPPTAPPTGVSVTCTARPRDGTAPLAVDFTATPSGGTGQYQFDWVFGEPGSPRVSDQNPSFTYTDEPPAGQQFIQYSAVVRVMSPPGQDPLNPRPGQFADCRQIITVRRGDPCVDDKSAPSVLITDITPAVPVFGFLCIECSGETTSVTVTADADDASGIQDVSFSAAEDSGRQCGGGPASKPARGPSGGGGLSNDTAQAFAAFSGAVNFPTPDCLGRYGTTRCFVVSAEATDTCGNSATDSLPVLVDETFSSCNFNGQIERKGGAGKAKGRAGAKPRGRQNGADRRVVWTSDLRVPGGRGQIVMNGTASVAPGEGRAYAVTPSVKGENRVEATLVNASGKPGTWRFEFTGNSVKPGSIRVIAGEASLVAGGAIEFRLKGTPGERIVFAFVRN